MLGAVPPGGEYFSPAKMIVMLLLAVPWLAACPWVRKDVQRVRGPVLSWAGAVLAAGGIGLLLWLLIPVYFVGLLLYVVLAGGALGAYVAYRNGRVPDKQKVFTASHLQRLSRKQKAKAAPVNQLLKLYDSHNKLIAPPDAERASAAEIATFNAAQRLIHDMIWRRASRADLSPTSHGMRLRYEIDGVLVDRPAPEPSAGEAIIQFLKANADMDVEDRRRPQEGMVSADLPEGGQRMDITLITAGTTGGQRVQFRLLQESFKTDIESLGMAPDVLVKVEQFNKPKGGILLISGPPRNGVSSTLYSLLRRHDAFTRQLVALEKETLIDLENITQGAYRDSAKLPGALASVLRRDPDVVMLDRCPDPKTASLVCDSADSKTFLIGAAASDSFQALARWVKNVEDPVAAMKHLKLVLCQVLLRQLCPTCRQAYRPDPGLLKKANLAGQQVENFYRPPARPEIDDKGRPIVCPTCQNSRYVGRTAAFEMLVVDDEMRQLVAEEASLSQIRAAARKKGMLYLQEQALRKVMQGATSVQEVIRVTQKDKKS